MKLEIFTPIFLSVLLWLAFGKLLIIKLFTVLKDLPFYQLLRIFSIEVSKEQTVRELKATWVVLTDAIVLALLAEFGLIRFAPESLSTILLTFLVFFIWVEIWFYWSHRWLHQSNIIWRFHQHHHLSVINQPLTATSFSFMEKFVFYTCGWFLLPTLISWYIPISPCGIAAYFTCYYIASTIAHSNTEFSYFLQKRLPWGLDKLVPSSTSHALHHVRYQMNFGGPFTSVLDKACGTYVQNTEKIQSRVSLGKSLTSLEEVYE